MHLTAVLDLVGALIATVGVVVMRPARAAARRPYYRRMGACLGAFWITVVLEGLFGSPAPQAELAVVPLTIAGMLVLAVACLGVAPGRERKEGRR